MKKMLYMSILFILPFMHCADAQKKQTYKYFPVLRIIDGDTFVIDDNSRKGSTVRLIGVDAPETRNTARKVKSEFGAESKKYLEKLIGGKSIRLEIDADRTDRYGRTLAYVYLENGTFVNAELVKNGYANIMTVPPNVKYQELFLKLERRARKRSAGLWGE